MMHRSFEQLDKADLARVYALARKRLDAMLADSITGKHYLPTTY